jgi:hypothetical protein
MMWGCEVITSDGAGCVKSKYCEEEMELCLSVHYGSGANKVQCQTNKLNMSCSRDIFCLWPVGIISENKIIIQNKLGLHHAYRW